MIIVQIPKDSAPRSIAYSCRQLVNPGLQRLNLPLIILCKTIYPGYSQQYGCFIKIGSRAGDIV